MAKLEFTELEVKNYIKGQYNHPFYKDNQCDAEDIRIHADGCYPKCIIEERRPNEPDEVKCYREKIWTAKTKPTFTKVYNSLQKIRRSSDWYVKYPDLDQFSRIAEEENLESYCEKKYPYFTSVTNWIFQAVLREYLIDANGGVLVLPLGETMENEYVRPYPVILNSCHVIDFIEDDYAVLENPLGCKYGTEYKQGRSFYFVTKEYIWQYDQINGKGGYQVVMELNHNLGVLPYIPWKGALVCTSGHYIKYESRISGMIPELDEAVREYSDVQAAKVLHIYPERWEFSQNECTSCKGTGKRRNPQWYDGCATHISCDITCDTCHGVGYVAAGPYSKIMVRPIQGLEAGGTQIPTPPAGYIEKDVEIVKVMEESIDKHLYNALASINFEFLSQSPLAQSGVAKSQDRDEAGNTASSIAEDLVNFADKIYQVTARYRYNLQYSNEEINSMLPIVNVPEKFDLVTAADISESLKMAKDSKVNPQILNAIEIEYAQKKFAQEPKIRDMVHLTLSLDPLAGVSEEDKMTRLSNKGITQLTYITSSNIQEFVQKAIDDNGNFPELDLRQQKEIIKRMAEEILSEQSARQQIMDAVQPDIEDNGEGGEEVSTDNSGEPEGDVGADPGESSEAGS